ncbi:hypothetical protein [Blastococcus saxobsidens]|uniref:Uncharacterized protein n=1 Tax=Blastococcus saxobsidens (strain DD2) TaxID=1146883 RepID=H6RJU2_BLASD|nr:hypothetical protein [Blastococcus saxobsidens]CCG03595.1 conserved protein of unknown function [Blastococcus saxobsidens DD2]
MSEYQYYEFAAIDRPLSVDEQAGLRAISTRAQITPTSFVNHYEWRDLKADPRRLVEHHFDAFLYLANWGTHRLMFRLPAEVLRASVTAGVGQYLVGDCSTAWTADGFVVIDLLAEDEDGEYDAEWLDGSGLLASIVPVRAELMAGDLRLLYFAWLLAVQNHEVEEDAVEPLVPPGLGQLSAALSAVAGFLRIDPDLVAVAAECSAPLNAADTLAELPGWLTQLPAENKDDLLLRVARGDGVRVRAELLAGCRRAAAPIETGDVSGRSAADLLTASRWRREDRQRAAAEHAQRRAEERRRAAELARENHLSELAGRQDQAWREVVELVERRTAADYDAAAGLLHELAEVCRREGTSEAFAVRAQQLRREQRRKISFIQRLDRLGMV